MPQSKGIDCVLINRVHGELLENDVVSVAHDYSSTSLLTLTAEKVDSIQQETIGATLTWCLRAIFGIV